MLELIVLTVEAPYSLLSVSNNTYKHIMREEITEASYQCSNTTHNMAAIREELTVACHQSQLGSLG